MPVLKLRHYGEQFLVPRQEVDVDLHDPQIGDRGNEIGVPCSRNRLNVPVSRAVSCSYRGVVPIAGRHRAR
jgi:hypothetical protein